MVIPHQHNLGTILLNVNTLTEIHIAEKCGNKVEECGIRIGIGIIGYPKLCTIITPIIVVV